jgi:transposase InsO family protein
LPLDLAAACGELGIFPADRRDCQSCRNRARDYDVGVRDLAILLIHLLTTVAGLLRPGGAPSLVAESLLLRQQLLILSRGRKRAPNLNPADRVIAALCSRGITSRRLLRCAIVLRPATLMAFHRALVQRKYRLLFSPKQRRAPGPKGPSAALIAAILAIKQRNPRFGCRRIAQQLAYAFDIDIDKDLVRRVLAQHYRPESGGPSWLTFLGHTKDCLWSVDLMRCESLLVKTHWVMVVMDHCTRRIVGFAVQAGGLDGPSVCRMFNQILNDAAPPPRALSSDHDPLFEFQRWRANLRVLEIEEVKTVPHVPLSHPFVERLIGTLRREFLDHVPFWSARDLQRKLVLFQEYYNRERVHSSLGGVTPSAKAQDLVRRPLDLAQYRWQSHCRGLFQLPASA